MNKRKIISKSIEAAQLIAESSRTPRASHIHLDSEYIQQLADQENIPFESMVKLIKNKLYDEKRDDI